MGRFVVACELIQDNFFSDLAVSSWPSFRLTVRWSSLRPTDRVHVLIAQMLIPV